MYSFFLIFGAVIIFVMTGYALFLLYRLSLQKRAFQHARLARQKRLKESCLIIARAMQSGECNLSEGVIRLKMLLDPMGLHLALYPAMNNLYEVVMDMPTHEKRRQLKKAQRQHLDSIREKSEEQNKQQIHQELPLFIQQLTHLKQD